MALLKDITLGRYYPGDSFVHNLDPRSKLLASLLFMFSLFIYIDLWSLLLLFMICAFGFRIAGIPYKFMLKNMKPFFWLFLITFLIHLLTTQGDAIYTIPLVDLTITQEGITNGTVYSFRLALLIAFAALLTMTTAPIELTDSLEKLFSPLKGLKVPVHEFALMMTLALRFIPILLHEAERIRNAQLSRGLALEGRLIQRIRNIIPMILPLMVSAIRRADELAVAMEARNYAGGSGRTSYRKLGFVAPDYALLTCTIVGVCGLYLVEKLA